MTILFGDAKYATSFVGIETGHSVFEIQDTLPFC
ncbi:hypothetical protein ACVLHI_000522 [Paenibacillus sp. PvR053]